MLRIILIFGAIAGAIVATLMLSSIALLGGDHGGGSMLVGYLTMLIALSMIFIAVKRHRDVNLGGTIKFLPALGLGLGVTLVAGMIYVIAWDIYYTLFASDFMDVYVAAQIEAMREAGVDEAEIAAYEASLQPWIENYQYWWFRMPLTFTEIAPVGVIVSLVSAALLRNPNVLPARA